MAKPRQRLSRVRDRVLGASGGVRGSRDGADHTTSRRRRVRHRRTRVRDHRGRTRVRDHRGRTQEQSLLAFSVTLTAPRPDLLEGLTLHGESTTGQELDFPLRRVVDAASPTLECEVQVTLDPAEDESQEWTLTLATADGQTLDTQDVSAPEGEVDALKLTWHITVPSVVVEVTSPVTPTLYGYALHVVPACPEPDPTLDWSGVDIGSDPTTEEPV